MRNPLHLTNEKTKDLRDRLEWAARQLNLPLRIPMIHPAVFLSASGLDAHLDEVQATKVFGRDGASRGLPTIWDDLLSRPPERDSWRVTPELSRKLGDLLGRIGVAASSAHLRFGDDWTMRPDVLDAGTTWEDRLADRSGLISEQGRVRIYLTALQTGEEQRRSVERAARREYQVLQGITHPGIAQALDLREHSGGPAILFRHRASDLRLDSYLVVHADRLNPAVRLDLVRQLAEAVRYAHSRSLYHRALAARSVYVSARDDGSSPILRIIDWQSAARDADATSGTAISASSLPGRHTGDADVYLAPESAERYADPGDLDIFGLGAVAYLILTGQPPAADRPALQARLAAEGGLHLFAASDDVSAELDELVFQATRADVNERLESAEAFLLFLDEPEQKVAEATPATAEPDPLQARPGDELRGGWVVRRVLGTGSTARALLVVSQRDRDDDVEVRTQVLKVALDDVKAQRLEAEAEALKKVGGGSIIRRYDGPRLIRDRTVLDLEFAGEQSLGAQLRAEGRLSYHDLERFGGDLFAALKELAAHGVRHRDIKPDNLGVQVRADRSRQLKLFDFSLADVPDRDISVGTRAYLDPFLGSVRRAAYDDHAEWYAAAVTLYEMATGTRLEWDFGGVGPLQSTVELPPIAADLFEPGLREGLTAFFTRCLHRDVERRFDTLDQLETAWRAVFITADAARPATTPATAALDAGEGADETGVEEQRAGELLQGLHRAHHLADLPGPAVVGPVEDRHAAVPGHRQAGLDLLQVRATVLGMTELGDRELLVGLGVGPVQRDRGHVPVHPGHLQPERLDRRQTHRPGDLVQDRGDRVQRPTCPVVVQRLGRHPEHLTDRPLPRLRLHTPQRRRRGQPVGDQHLDHLPVRDHASGHLTHRAQRVDHLPDPQPAAEIRHHRQRPEHLLHTRRRAELRPPCPCHTPYYAQHRANINRTRPIRPNSTQVRKTGLACLLVARSVLWFRRDLRLADHPALLAASGESDVVPLFVLDPRLWNPAGPPRQAWLLRSLRALDAALDGGLVIRSGDARDVIPAFAVEAGAHEVHVSA
ncbi:MAG TPA: deoxyribodipyrimidine photo-lyase, partial [Kineosporiaceae bacterium]